MQVYKDMYLVRWDAQYDEYLYYYIRFNLAPAPTPSAPLWQEGLVYVWSMLSQDAAATLLFCFWFWGKVFWKTSFLWLVQGTSSWSAFMRLCSVFSQSESEVTCGSEKRFATFRQKWLVPEKDTRVLWSNWLRFKNYRIERGHLHVGLGEYS